MTPNNDFYNHFANIGYHLPLNKKQHYEKGRTNSRY